MPGLDFDRLRSEIQIQQVLDLLGFVATDGRGDQLYGSCPLHESSLVTSRCFSVNVRLNRYRCHKCGSLGNQLELWAAARQKSIFDAAVDLCEQLRIEPPWLPRR